MKKKNLTLRMDQEVIEKAKELGINISSLTENLLKTKSLSDLNSITPTSELRRDYRVVFRKIAALMKTWGITYYLKIGENKAIEEIGGHNEEVVHSYYLNPIGRIEEYIEEFEHTAANWRLDEETWPIRYLFHAEKLISSLVNLIYKEAEHNKGRLEDLQLLKNFLESIEKKDVASENRK